ncbi:MAG: phage portal protein [Deltaproteobacteria bacterium]|nr:phage portal protein [Deltaproteobacteria bacterium]
MSWLNMFGKAGKPTERKAADLSPLQRLMSITLGRDENPYTYQKAVSEGYFDNDIIYSGVDLVASNFASVPLQVKEIGADGEQRDATSQEAQRLRQLLARPNILQSGTEWLYAVAAFRSLGGDGYTRLITSSPGSYDEQPSEMFPVSPPSVDLRTDTGNMFYQYNPASDFSGMNQSANFPIDLITGNSNIMQWGSFNPNTIASGTSPLQAANLNSDIYRFGNIWNRAYFKSGCRPSFALESTAAEGLSDEEFNRLKKELEENYSGLENGNGRPLLLERAKAHTLSQSPKDADFSVSHDQQARDVSRTLKIPPILLSMGSDTTFANLEAANLMLWEGTIIPLWQSFSQTLNYQLTPRYGDNIIVVPDFSKIPALEPRRKEAWERAQNAQFLTVDEKRKLVGLDPTSGGNVILVGSNMIPLDVASSFSNLGDESNI